MVLNPRSSDLEMDPLHITNIHTTAPQSRLQPLNIFFALQDVDHRVREANQQAMEQLVLRVGRNLAPHLRYIIGPWLCSQFDTYPTVASAGRRSFLAAFSEEKQADVILFCRKELFEVCKKEINSNDNNHNNIYFLFFVIVP